MRLDKALVHRGLVSTRSQAESFIKLGAVQVNGKVATKAGIEVRDSDKLQLTAAEQYVSRAGLKLASVAEKLHMNFASKVVLDVGSSTGGFTDYVLQHGANKVIAVDVGTDQLHPSLQQHPRIELHEKTDIRQFNTTQEIDIVVIDVSFISIKEVLPSVKKLAQANTQIIAMVKPQFEAGSGAMHSGVIKNDTMRRDILAGFEQWARANFVIIDKADSEVAGAKGNKERFYLLRIL